MMHEASSELPVLLGQSAAPAPNFLEMMIPFILIFVIMYFLIIRPQQKRMKAHREMVANVRRGDEIITQGGLYGKITRVKEGDVDIEVEISEGVKVRLVRGTIADVVSKTEPVGESDKAKS